MSATGRRVGVNVYQIIETVALSLGLPVLVPVIIGPCYQIHDADEEPAGSYVGIAATYPYPGLIGGAIVDLDSVKVYGRFRDKALEEIDPSHWTADETGVSVDANLQDSEGRTFTAIYIGYRAFRTDLKDQVIMVGSDLEIEQQIGKICLENPLAYAAHKCNIGTQHSFYVVAIGSDDELGYNHALEILEQKEVYFMVPLTQNPGIIQMFKDHVNQMSDPLERKERIVLSTIGLILEDLKVSDGTVGSVAHADNKFVDTTKDFYDLEVVPGDIIEVDQEKKLEGYTGEVTTGGMTLTDMSVDFVAAGVAVDDFLYIPFGTNEGYRRITQVDQHVLTVDSAFADDSTNLYYEISRVGPIGGKHTVSAVIDANTIETATTFNYDMSQLKYTIKTDYRDNKYEQAQAIADYAAGYSDTRVVVIWPDIVEVSYNNSRVQVPSYYLAAYVAGLSATLPADQPFANLPLGGDFIGVLHSNDYFNEKQLRTITSGGVMLAEQDNVNEPLRFRRQYTTDTSDIKLRAYSIRKALDWAAKFYRNNLKLMTGRYNIEPRYLQRLGIIVEGLNKYVSHPTKGVFVDVNTINIYQDPIELDHVAIKLRIGVKYPANEIDVYFYI